MAGDAGLVADAESFATGMVRYADENKLKTKIME